MHRTVPHLGVQLTSLRSNGSVLGVTTDKNSALQGTFSAATKTVQVSVHTYIFILIVRGNDLQCFRMSMAHRRFWVQTTLADPLLSTSFYVNSHAPNLRPIRFWQGDPHDCSRQLYDHFVSLESLL